MYKRVISAVTIWILTSFYYSPAYSEVINVRSNFPGFNTLALDILEEMASYSSEYEIGYPYKNLSDAPTYNKVLADFDSGALDVIWTMSDASLEEKYRAIHLPIFMGMFGNRVAIIKDNNKDMFADVKSLPTLMKIRAGQGLNWADSDILAANGIPVIRTNKYSNLFPMLEGERFSYFPRAIHEPWREIVANSKYNLTVDEHILIQYRVGFYFFVRYEDERLYEFIRTGLEKMIASGRHNEMFLANDDVKMAIENANLKNRHIIRLHNPYLSEKTPLEREELWFNPSDY